MAENDEARNEAAEQRVLRADQDDVDVLRALYLREEKNSSKENDRPPSQRVSSDAINKVWSALPGLLDQAQGGSPHSTESDEPELTPEEAYIFRRAAILASNKLKESSLHTALTAIADCFDAPNQCEGCTEAAVTSDVEGCPLCARCFGTAILHGAIRSPDELD